MAGFTRGFSSGGGSVNEVLRGDFTRESGRALMQRALEDGLEPGTLVFGISDVVAIGAITALMPGTLVFGISDVVAIGAITALRASGRNPGDDIAVAGFDDIPASSDITPGLTTVRVPLHEVGYRALHAAVADDWAAEAQPLELEVLLRGSTPLRI